MTDNVIPIKVKTYSHQTATVNPSLRTHVENPLLRVGQTLLERMQEARGMPYYAPTVQMKALARGRYTDYEPVNPLARMLCDFARGTYLTAGQLDELRSMGFDVEVRP